MVDTRTAHQTKRILVALALCMGLQMTGFVMILPLFARRFEVFGAGVEALGMSAMAYALSSTVAAPFLGVLADRFGRRPIILLSLAAFVLAFTGYLFASSAWLMIVLRALAGLLTAGLVPAVMTVIGDEAAEDRRAQWVGIVNGGASIGWIVGPFLGGLLYDRFGYTVPFAVSIAMAAAALLLAVFLIPETRQRSPSATHPRQSWASGLEALRAHPTLALLMLITFGALFAWAFIEPQFMFYAYDTLTWSSSQLGVVMSTYGLACMVGEFTLSQLSDRLGRKPVLVVGLALFSAQFVGLVLFHDVRWIVVSFLLAGLGNALYDPALNAHILDIAPPDQTGRIMGLKGTVGSLGNMLGPAALVLFTPLVAPQGVFLIAAALVFLLTVASGLGLRATRVAKAAQAAH